MFLILNKEKKLKNLLFLVLLYYRQASTSRKIYRPANFVCYHPVINKIGKQYNK